MKKTVLAFAVAAAMGVPAVAAADTTLYGLFDTSIDYVNDAATTTRMANNSSRLGVRGSEDLGGGLSGIFQLEMSFDSTDTQDEGVTDNRNTFVGLAGDFGSLRLGQFDSAYKTSFNPANFLGLTWGDIASVLKRGLEAREANIVQYSSPNINGLRVAADYTVDDKDYSLSGSYSAGSLMVMAAYRNESDVTDDAAYMVGGTFTIDDLTLAAVYENRNSNNGYLLAARYNLGQVYIAANYMDDGADAKQFALGGGYRFSSRTQAYVAVANNDGGDLAGNSGKGRDELTGVDGTAFSVGVRHSF